MKNIYQSIKADLRIDDVYLKRILARRSSDIKKITIPKKNGGFRIANQIAIEFKPIQYWLIENFFSYFPISNESFAYIKKRSIKLNAEKHMTNNFFIKTDFQDFFTNIQYKDLEIYIKKNMESFSSKYKITNLDMQLIKSCCFDENASLAQGFCTSPIITNILMLEFDRAIIKMLDKYSDAEPVYTRYSDDIIISCKTKGTSFAIFKDIETLIVAWETPKLFLNQHKISFGSVGRGNVLITGLKINHNHIIDVTRQKKDEVKLLLKHVKKNSLPQKEYPRLKGLIEFIRYHSPSFFTKLNLKYFNEIEKLNVKTQ